MPRPGFPLQRCATQSFCLLLVAWAAWAQQDRIAGTIDTTRTALLRGNRSSRALPQEDLGPVDSGQVISGITLVFKRSASQQTALEQLLAEQQDNTSPNYHNWIAPEAFADRFGLSSGDSAKVAGWLRSLGFSVAYEARSRTYVTCSGTAAQVRSAFHTELHRYRVEGETHFANSSDPSIPAALEPVVLLVQGLDDFYPKAPRHRLKASYTGSNGGHALVPGDIAVIYDINPLYQNGVTGSGQKVAVMGSSNINMSDIEYFRASLIGLPKNDPQMVLVPGSVDPGTSNQDAQVENTLDLEYAGAIAQNAAVVFVYSPNVWASTQYAVDQSLAPVITTSYSLCEEEISSSPSSAVFFRSLAQQGNAEGITWTSSTGDWGAAGCDTGGVQVAANGLAVEIPSSVPEVTAVGGTEFNESGGTYWSASNNPANNSSALGYIPEMAWNDTSISIANGGGLSSTGGGASIFFSKPAWQTGPGVPNDGARDVPDISFDAANDHDPYLIWVNGAASYMGGTSVSTPIFAGVVTLLNQYLVSNGTQSKPGLGNINPTLYSLAQTPRVFHDITVGNNIVPCTPGTPDCVNGQLGYNAGPGFDLATGLGSADIYSLFSNWPGQPGQGTGATATTITLAANPATFPISGTTMLTATVTAASGTYPPNGSVSFNAGTKALGAAILSGAGRVVVATLTVYGSQLAVGANTISVSYGGSTTFKPSSSSTSVTVTVPTTASAVIPSVVPDPVYQDASPTNGCLFFFTIRLNEIAGVATTLTGFTFGATDYSSSIPAFFGSGSIPAYGTISDAFCASVATVPSTLTLGFNGVDASGKTWAQQIAVPFYPAQVSASMALSSSPGTEVENPNGDPRCPSGYPFYQELNLQEQNGYEVYLNRFLAGGYDLSDQIASWFGSLRLAPLGNLQAEICWQLDSTPATLSYEIDGVDANGNTVTTTASVPFNPSPAQSGGSLTASSSAVNLSVAAGQSATASVGVNLAAGQAWTASLFPANQKTSWLVVYPQSGTGPGQVNVVASGAGLANGVYTATLVLQSVNTIPQFVNVPITFTIGGSSNINITSVANGASFQQAFAPGMILSVFGTNLSNAYLTANTVPLPYTLGGVSASINGVRTPLYGVYALGSTSQINLQIPYEIPARTALVAVNNNGQVATFAFDVAPASPGIFYNYDSGLLTPIGAAAPGQSVVFFITGEGDVSPFVTTGSTPTGVAITQPPAPRLPFTLTVGGVPVIPAFVGIPSWSVGVTQVNFTVPANVPGGKQPVVVTVGGVPSSPGYLDVQSGPGNVQITFIPPSVNQSSDGKYYYNTQLTETGGVGVNFTNLMVFGNDCTSDLTNWFGATSIPAYGTLTGDFVSSCTCNPPWDGTWQISGTDDNGNSNTWSGVVHFLPPSTTSDLPSALKPLALWRDTVAPDATPAEVRLYPAWQATMPAAAVSPSRLFDLLVNSGATPPSHPEGARNDKAVSPRDR
jgi:uncharacterized protein (TIGR03437 family)